MKGKVIKMRFTKVLREYVDDELTKKRLEANNNDIDTIAYKKHRQEAIDKIKSLVEELQEEVEEIMAEYELENLNSRYYNIIQLNDSYIGNSQRLDIIRKREANRYDKQKKAMKEIEVNCTLGADREEFMKMLNDVIF